MGNYNSDQKNARRYALKLSKNTDADLIEKLDQQENIQGYLKRLIREDITKGAKSMKTYIIKPEYLAQFGSEAKPMTVLTDSDIERLAADWEMSEDDLRDQLIEQEPTTWTAIHRFVGKPDWQELNDLIREDSGVQEDFFETEEDYKKAVHDGFVKYDWYYTTIYED
jgi:hypothetical protein